MHRFIPIAAACCAVAAVAILSLPASAKQGENRSDWFEPFEIEYLDVYERCWAALGAQCGANLVDDYDHDQARVEESTARMKAWLNPPEPAVEETYTEETTYSEPTTYAPATSSSGCPSSMADEADSPTDVNPDSGASGCYQVIPSTQEAMGAACADVNAPSCLAALCANGGNAHWAASGATPC